MNKLWLIIKREYLVRVRKKTFILTTLLTPIAIMAIYAIPLIIVQFSDNSQTIAVKDDSGIFVNPIADSDRAKFKFLKDDLEQIRKTYKDSGFDGVLYIPAFKSLNNELRIQYFSDQQISVTSKEFIESRIARRIRNHKMELAGLDQKQLDELKTDVTLEQKKQTVNEKGEIQEEVNQSNAGIATAIGFGMAFFMYMVLIIYGMMVMRSVMEEKINRIVEVIISSVKPFQLMLGKLIGVGGVGLTQLLIWVVALTVLPIILFPLFGVNLSEIQSAAPAGVDAAQAEEAMSDAVEMLAAIANVNWGFLLPMLVVFFLGGYFIYASLFAAVGSAIGDDLGEGQSLTIPIMLPIIIGFFIVTTIIDNPNNPIAVFGSIFPLFSPIVMPARLAFDPPLWEVLLSVVLLIAATLFFVWLSGRIYRVGIFMYGKKVTPKEIWKWLFYKG